MKTAPRGLSTSAVLNEMERYGWNVVSFFTSSDNLHIKVKSGDFEFPFVVDNEARRDVVALANVLRSRATDYISAMNQAIEILGRV